MADDPRDDELAAQLRVEPLDDVTRRRLVRRALAESAAAEAPEAQRAPAGHPDRSRLTRVVAAAAMFLVLAVGVVALLTMSDGGNDTTEAGRKTEALESTPQAGSGSAADQRAAEAAGAAEPAPSADTPSAASAVNEAADASSTIGPTNLGDVGDLSTAAARRRLLDTIDAAALAAPTAQVPQAFGAGACAPGDLSSLVASATGTFHGRNADVVVTERADGSRRVRLVISDPCEVRQLR